MREHIATIETGKELLFWSLIAAIITTVVCYGYLINTTVLHIVERKSIESDTQEALAHISELESDYFALKMDVTKEVALKRGFTEPSDVIFATRDATLGLAIRD